MIDDDVWTRRQEDIWDEATARDYDSPGTGMFAPEVLGPTVDRLVDLAAGGRALELAIGTGRVAVPLHERGVPVAGIELSEPMIAQLRTKVDEYAIPVVHGDMTSARVDGGFSLVYLVFNTIGNLQTQDEQVECFRNAARHLSPGGRFVVELGVPDLRTLPLGRTATVFATEPGYLGVDVYDVAEQRMCRCTCATTSSAATPAWPAGRSATSGRPSSTSWPGWPACSWSTGGRTGRERRSPTSRPRTCRCTGSRERAAVAEAGGRPGMLQG